MNSSNRSASRIRGAASIVLLAAAAAFSGGAAAQQAVGRVLVAVGTVSIERGGDRIPGAAGIEVRKGDTIQVGQQSNAQLRFVDESIVALRADTTFRISEFSFRGAGQEKDSGIFALLKGGLRTVTGLISKENYSVETPTATIGIRGTHYTLRVCNNDCFETTTTAQAPGAAAPLLVAAAGSPASDAGPLAQLAQSGTPVANGTYGSVTDGRISVTNQSGASEFGADQYFHVASRASTPQQLIGPPSFLRDRLDGRGRGNQQRTSGQQQSGASQSGSTSSSTSGSDQGSAAASTTSSGSETATTVAPTGQGAGSGDSRVSSSVASASVPIAITPTLTQVANQVSTVGPTTVLQTTTSSANNVYRFAGMGLNIPFSCGSPPCGGLGAVDLIVQVNPTSQTARIVLAVRDFNGNQANINNTYGDFPVTIAGNQLVIHGTANAADFPNSQGSFRCSGCSPANTLGVFTTTDYLVTINGNVATLTVTATDSSGISSFTAALPQVTQTSFTNSAVAGRNFGTNGGAGVYTQLNSAGQPIFVGEPLQIGSNLTAIGTAVNQTIGGNASAGNLVWGTWTGQATGVNGNFVPFTQGVGSVSPWIVGDQTNVLPPSLGVATFTTVGSIVGNGIATTGTLNSASFTADFVNRNLAVSINATNAPASSTYQMSGNASFSAINGRFAAGFTSISCTGPCGSGGGAITGSFNGAFTGANALGAAMSFAASNANAGVFGVIGFKR